MYPLMFPTGQLGWEPNTILLTNIESNNELDSEITDVFSDISDECEDLNTLINQEQISEDQLLINDQNIDQVDYSNTDYTDNTDNTDTSGSNPVKKMRFVSAMQYYAYLLCDRKDNYLHYFGRLFHQYIVDQFAKIELGRLNYFRFNQDKIRADLYQNIKNADPNQIGKTTGTRIVLPSTYKGM